jgi:hypothetical protein
MSQSASRALPEYPDGDKTVTLSSNDPAGRDFGHVGWATIVLKQTKGVDKDRLRKQCLGVFGCPVKDCAFVARPKTQPKARAQQAADLVCSTHQAKVPLVLVLGACCCCRGRPVFH